MRRDAGAAAFFVAAAVAMTWPLARILDRGVANPGDPYQLSSYLDWDWFAAFHQPLRLFQAPMFFPARDTLAYGEHLFGIAIFLFPLRALGVSSLAAHNVAVILGLAFTGFAAYLLGRELAGSAAAGIAAGLFYAFLPWRFTQLPHVNYLFAPWQPLLVFALLRCARRPGWKSAAMFGAVFLLNGWSNLHLFVFGSFAIALSAPLVVRDRAQWLRMLAATLVAAALIVPFLIPYFRVARETGMQRSWAEVKSWSATPRDWLNPGAMNRLYRRFFDPKTDPELWLFPGAGGIALAAVGVYAARRERRTLALALLWLAAGFIGSLGVHAFFHRFLFSHVPGFRSLRVPARWADVAYVGLTMLVALGTATLARHRRWAGALVSALLLVELNAAPIRWHSGSSGVPPVYRWLRTQRGPIAELPIGGAAEFQYLRYLPEHRLRTANGISSFMPRRSFELADAWADPARRDALLDDLRASGIRLVILHGDALPAAERPWLRSAVDAGRLRLVQRFDHGVDGDWVFRFDGATSASADLDRYLRGEPTFNTSTFGVLEQPQANTLLRRNATFSGWALSPYGVRAVNLLFDNGGVRVPATLADDPVLRASMPWYDATTRPRFIATFERRPRLVTRDTDVQVEIIDGRGERTLLEGRWFWWDR